MVLIVTVSERQWSETESCVSVSVPFGYSAPGFPACESATVFPFVVSRVVR